MCFWTPVSLCQFTKYMNTSFNKAPIITHSLIAETQREPVHHMVKIQSSHWHGLLVLSVQQPNKAREQGTACADRWPSSLSWTHQGSILGLCKETCLLMPQAALLLAQLWIKKLFPQIPNHKNDWGHGYDRRWLFILRGHEKRHTISLFMGKSHSKKWQWHEVDQDHILYLWVFFPFYFVHWVQKTNFDFTYSMTRYSSSTLSGAKGTTETVSFPSMHSTSNLPYCWNPHPHLVSSCVLWGL